MNKTAGQQHRRPPRAMALAATLCVVAGTAAGVGNAGAAPVVSEHFPYTHRTEFFCVPSGVTELTVTAVGGAGATYRHTGTGGAPGVVVGTFAVVPQTELAITVGQWGHERGGFGDGKGGHHGTSPGSSTYSSGGGGGGSTSVKSTTSPCGTHSLSGAT